MAHNVKLKNEEKHIPQCKLKPQSHYAVPKIRDMVDGLLPIF